MIVPRVYRDVAEGDFKAINKKCFKEFKRYGHLVKALYEGCTTTIFLKNGRKITEEEYTKELAVFLLKEA